MSQTENDRLRSIKESMQKMNGCLRQASSPQLAQFGSTQNRQGGSGVLQKRLVEAAEKVERVLHETHDAYARLEAQDQRLLPLQGMLESNCDTSRLDNFRKFIVDLRAQHSKAGISSSSPSSSPFEQISHGESIIGSREEAPVQTSFMKQQGQALAQAGDASRKLDPAMRLELIGSIEVLEQEMAQLTDLAAYGEQAAGQVAGVRRSLERLWNDVGKVGPRAELMPRSRSPRNPLDDRAPSPELRGMVASLRKEVLQLTDRCNRGEDEAASTKQEINRVREAVIGLYRQSTTGLDTSSLGEEVTMLRREVATLRNEVSPSSSSAVRASPGGSVVTKQELSEMADGLKKEWAQLLDMGMESIQQLNAPRGMQQWQASASRQRDVSPSMDLVEEVQGLKQQLSEASQDIRQLVARCDRAAEEAAGARHDVDKVRGQISATMASSPSRGMLGESDMSELRQNILSECRHYVDRSTVTREELNDEFVKLKSNLLDSKKRQQQDIAELEVTIAELARREFETLASRKQPSSDHALLEELKELEEKITRQATALAEVTTMKSGVASLRDTVNILKANVDASHEKSNEKIENVEQELRGLRQRYETGDVSDAVKELRANPPRFNTGVSTKSFGSSEDLPVSRADLKEVAYKEVNDALHKMMDPMVTDISKMQTEISEMQTDIEKVGKSASYNKMEVEKMVEHLQALRVRNVELPGELREQMERLEKQVRNLSEDLIDAIGEIKEGGSPISPSFQAAQFEEFKEEAQQEHFVLKERIDRLEETFEVKLRDALEMERDFINTKTFLRSDIESLEGKMQLIQTDIQRNRTKIFDLEASPSENPGAALAPREVRSSSLKSEQMVTRQDLQDMGDLVRQEMLVLEESLKDLHRGQQGSGSTNIAMNEEVMETIMIMRQDLDTIKDQASLGTKDVRAASELNEAVLKELSVLRGTSSEDASDTIAATVEELRQDIENIRAGECKQIRHELTELTARMITDRSMVTASVAAAMSLAQSNGTVSEDPISKVLGNIAPFAGSGESFRLRVTVLSARGLRMKTSSEVQLTRKVSPMCTCSSSDGKWRFQSEVIANSADPEWRYTFETQSYELGSALQFDVWDQDVDGKLIGSARLDAKRFYPDGYDGPLTLSEAGAPKRRSSLFGKRNSADGMKLLVLVELLGKPQIVGEAERGKWTYVVLASEGISLRRSLSYDLEEVDRKLSEGELVVVSQRLRSEGANIFYVGSETENRDKASLWAFSLDPLAAAVSPSSSSSSPASMVEATVENGLWSAVIVASEGLRPLRFISIFPFSNEEQPIPKGTSVQLQQRVRVGKTCFLRLSNPTGDGAANWLNDVQGDERLVDNVCDLLGDPVEVSATETDLGMELQTMSSGACSIASVLSVAANGWASRNGINEGTVIVELDGQEVALMDAEEFQLLYAKRPLNLKIRRKVA